MVSGTQWPGGDPFLQRQNEPSLAVSSRNALHLVAGANDYRTVDLPTEPGSVPGTLSGDAWLGVFKSFDGGLSWQSTLLPGYPQDQSAAGKASPLKVYGAAADPTVRAGANGLVYYSGMAFNRGTNIGAIFLSRYFDANAKENGDATAARDTIAYLDAKLIDTGTSGQFLDKPWIAVDVPRSGSGATTCSVTPQGGPAQSFVGGNVYMTWSRFTGSQSTKIMFSRSLDCGKTWSNPIKISESNSINQGTNIAVDPTNGTVYVAWRRFAASNQPDAILVSKSTDFGQSFTSKNTVSVATISPFDQGTSGTRFRTNALPSIAVSEDASHKSRVHIAWAQRNAPDQDARIVLATSTDGLGWPTPFAVVDGNALSFEGGTTFGRGHQFMPQLTFSQGRLMVLYYDQRLDHTLGLFTPYHNDPFAPDANGNFYKVNRDLRPLSPRVEPVPVFGLTVDDLGLQFRRHTIDLRVAEASAGASMVFRSASVSQYRIGLRSDLKDEEGNPLPLPIASLDQLQSNPPNLPLFAQGTVPFLGDYIDIAGPTIVPDGAGGWKFNTASTAAPVFYATWTDNRDVVPPADGDWTHYTPPGSTSTGVPSVLDPTKTTLPCVPGQAGMRNQNIYSSRITEGLLVGSPQNVKPLFAAPKARAFIVTLQNLTSQERSFTLTLAPASGVGASFQQTASTTLLNVTVAAHSGAARPVFASSSNPAGSVTVTVTESATCSGTCLSGSVVLNPEGSVSSLAQPDGTSDDIGSIEIYTPTLSIWNPANPNPFLNIANPNVSNPNVSNPNVSNADPAIVNLANPNVSNPNVSNPNVSNPNVSNPNVSNVDPAIVNLTNPNVSNPNVSNTTAANPNISNPNVSNPNISNVPVTDMTYAVTNSGNTAHSYRVALYGNNSTGKPLQIIVTKNYFTQTTGVGCSLQNVPQASVLANVNDAVIAPSLASATDPNIPDGDRTNATMALAPGETAFVTLRGALSASQLADLTRSLTPVVTAHGKSGAANDFAMLLFIQTAGGTTLPAAVVGTPYSWTFQVVGGKSPLHWTLVTGSTLPTGLTLSDSGILSGTPTGGGSFVFTVNVSDSTNGTPQNASQTFNLTVTGATTSVAFSSSPASPTFGQPLTLTASVTTTATGSGIPSPGGSVVFSDGGTTLGTVSLSGGTASYTSPALATGGHSFQVAYTGDTNFTGSTVGPVVLTVQKAASTTALSSSVNPSTFDQAVTFTANVSGPGATPGGSVTFKDGATVLGTISLAGGTATYSTSSLSVAAHSITAVFGGDGNFNGSTSSAFSQEVQKASSTTIVTGSPNPSTFGASVTFTATVTSPAGTPTGTVTFLDGATSLGTGALNAGVAAYSTSALVIGSHAITASYAGDSSFVDSSSGTVTQVVNVPPYTFIGFQTPLATAGTLAAPTYSGTANYGNGVPVKYQLLDYLGNNVTELSSTVMIQAVANSSCSSGHAPDGAATLLYSPTTGAKGGSTFRSGSSGFIFNWDTGIVPGPGCYTLVVQPSDGSVAKATNVRLQ
jgi:uncharacterized protein YjbI with pentapeptide repeats